MAPVTLIFTLLANVKTEIDGAAAESSLNQLLGTFPAQIRTSEATPAAFGGNGGTPISRKDFQAISQTSPEDKKSTTDKSGPIGVNQDGKMNIEALPMVWENCMETMFRENQESIIKVHDMEVPVEEYPENLKETTNSWSKRNALNHNTSAARNAWIEKYNSLLNSKADLRRQQKPEYVPVKKVTSTTVFDTTDYKTTIYNATPNSTTYLSSTTSTTPTSSIIDNIPEATTKDTITDFETVPIIPITRDVFQDTQYTTSKNIVPSYTEDWFDITKVKEKTEIRFNSLPQRTTYLIPTLRLEDGFHPFSFMSEFFYLIYPFEFPIGLVKDIVWGEFTFPYSFLQSIKAESTFLACIILFACIALVIPCYLFILAVLAIFSKSRCDDELETGALFPEEEDSDCNDKVLVAMVLFVLLISCALLTGMAVSNEQARIAASNAQNVVHCGFTDIAAWLSSAARELHHSLVPPVDLVLHAFKEDLRNVETLLGEPIQQAISSESGIDLVFDSLADIIDESEDLSMKISSLRDVSVKAGGIASAASDRVRELGRQLDNLKKHCIMRDMPLCDTVNTRELEMKMTFDLILHEQQLLQLRSLGVENLTRSIASAKREFRSLPTAITTQTEKVREAIIRDIVNRRQYVHASVQGITDIVRHLTAGLHTASRQLDAGLERLQRYELARWTLMFACVTLLGFVAALILMAILCGCGHARNHAQRTLKASAVWICVTSLIMWGIISTIFLITGHAEIYVCHALWDGPQYITLSTLFDRPSPLLSNNEGVFDAMFRDLDNITIDVSVSDVLRDCEKDRAAYVVFQLDKILDVNKVTSYFEWIELQADMGHLKSAVDVGLLRTISSSFSMLLSQMLNISDVNMTKYRLDYNGPVVGKDLPALVDQLENIAAQVSDLATAGKLETLASRTQRLYISNIKPLEQLRAEVVFKLTELELQLVPFRRKLNISLSHIHTAQFYINNQGDVIAKKKISRFVSRLVSHAAGWRTHVLTSTEKHAARCRPLFTVFSAARTMFCSNYIASLHGWWACGVFLGILWSTALTPLCVKLWRTYGWKIKAHEAINLANLGTGQQETPTTAPCDGSNWNTPGPPAPPPRNDSW